MKKRSILIYVLFILLIPFIQSSAQDIEVEVGDTVVYGSPGDVELVCYAQVINVSSFDQTVFLVRSENILPANWTSSLCFDITCYPSFVDSVTSEVLHPNDTVDASVHFVPDATVPGTGYVQIQFGTTHSPDLRTTINLTASTEPTAVNDEKNILDNFRLLQNYPNPFNPETVISYEIPQRSEVNIKVYNLMGQEVANLVNEVKDSGIHSVDFNAGNLSSGIYFYKITAGKFSAVKKMMLIK